MKIINNTKPDIKFGILDGGDVFEWAGELYIKTDGEEGVLLENGGVDTFPGDCLVRPVEAVLTVS